MPAPKAGRRALRELPACSNFSARQNGLRGTGSRPPALPTAAGEPKPLAPALSFALGTGWRGDDDTQRSNPQPPSCAAPASFEARSASCPALFCFSQEEASYNSTKRARERNARRAAFPASATLRGGGTSPPTPGTPLPAWATQGHSTLP